MILIWNIFRKKDESVEEKEEPKETPAESEIIKKAKEEKAREAKEQEISEEKEEGEETVEPKKEEVSEKELVKKYGVTEGIPKRKVAEEYVEESKPEEIPPEEEMKMSDMVLRLEKLDGKIEMLNKSRDETNEKLTQLAEEIGELRTMVMERERSFDEVKSQFEVVKETVTDLRPERLKKIFDKTEKDILANKAKIEIIETLVKELAEESRKVRRLMAKIKSFENLVDISYEMERKLSRINEIKNYADILVSKVENIFSELNQKMSQLENQREKIEKLDELTVEITKMLDEVSVKMTKFVTEKEFKDFKKSLEEDLSKLQKVGIQKVKVTGDQWVKESIADLQSKISKLKSVVASQNEALNDIIDRLERSAIETG